MSSVLADKYKVAISADFFNAFAAIPRQKQARVVDFITKFRNDPMSAGINYEKLHDAFDSNLRSVRIDDTYRGIVLKPEEGNVYLLLWVAHHDAAYDWASKKRCIVNPATGSIQVFDVNPATYLGESIEIKNANETKGLFDELDEESLKKIGIPQENIGVIRGIKSLEDLNKNKSYIPHEAFEALNFIAEGFSVDEVIKELFDNDQDGTTSVDSSDFEAALDKPLTKQMFVSLSGEEGEKELKEMLSAPLEKWRIFLHPSQRRLVEMKFNGAVRVLGGAGTGKTVVAMHRAKWLVQNFYKSSDDRILFTTYTVNLAADIKENLKKICKPEIMRRIEVVNLDKWVSDFLKSHGYSNEIIYGERLEDLWQSAMVVAPDEPAFPLSFYQEEWDKIIRPQEITSLNEYIKASRVGRGIRLDRKVRAAVWSVFDELKNLMNDRGVRDVETAMHEARIILQNKGDILPYKAIVVDEAQDFSVQAYKLLRQMAGEEHINDMFIVGDAHQRIYGKKVVLGKCGINIRGRSRTLKLNYRTTEETRNWAFKVLKGIPFDDLDEGIDEGKGYKSLMHGPEPTLHRFDTFKEETEFILKYIEELKSNNIELMDVCLVARTQKQLDLYSTEFQKKGIRIYEVKRSKIEDRTLQGLRLATMHRVKGLEFDYMIMAGMNDGIVPSERALESSGDNISRQEAEIAERSLVYVAATRAKKALTVTSYGKPSKFLE